MAELKTKVTKKSVSEFLDSVEPKEKRNDAKKLLAVMKKATGEKPKLWGTSIVGFGQYHYKSERSRQEGDWPLTGFSPRKQNLTVYVMPGFKEYDSLLKKIGPHKKSVGCLYFKSLEGIDLSVLGKIIKHSVGVMKKRYGVQ